MSPNKVESSHVVLKSATYTSVGVLIENSQSKAQSRGTVLVYCQPATKHFLIHVYLVPMYNPQVKEGIKNKETKWGFQWIDKPAFIKFVSEDITYNIVASEEVTIENKKLHCLSSASEQYPYATILIPEKCTTVNLHISPEGKKEKIWNCVLNVDDLKKMRRTNSRPPSESADLNGMPETPSTSSSPSDSEKAKTFLQKNYENLCDRLGLLGPILLSLRAQEIITEPEEQSITCHKLKIHQNEALLKMVKSKGVQEQFYKILKEKDQYLVQSLEQ